MGEAEAEADVEMEEEVHAWRSVSRNAAGTYKGALGGRSWREGGATTGWGYTSDGAWAWERSGETGVLLAGVVAVGVVDELMGGGGGGGGCPCIWILFYGFFSSLLLVQWRNTNTQSGSHHHQTVKSISQEREDGGRLTRAERRLTLPSTYI